MFAHGAKGPRRTVTTEGWAWLSLTFGDAVLSGQEALLEEALQHGAHGWPVDQLQHEEVGLQGRACARSLSHGPHSPHSPPPVASSAQAAPVPEGHVHSDALQEKVPGDLGEKALKDQDVSRDLSRGTLAGVTTWEQQPLL